MPMTQMIYAEAHQKVQTVREARQPKRQAGEPIGRYIGISVGRG